jgi:hypothetical protein
MERPADARAGMARALGLALLLVAAHGVHAKADPPAPKGVATASPRESVLGTRLLRGKLVGTSIVPVDDDGPALAPGRLAFDLLVAEDYTDLIGFPPGAIVRVECDLPVEVATLDATSYGREVAARLPEGVRMGGEVLVVAETRRTVTPLRQRFRLVSVETADADGTRRFLVSHASVLVALIEVQASRPAYNPQQAMQRAARLRGEGDAASDPLIAFHRRRQAWQELIAARKMVEVHERGISTAMEKLGILESIAVAESRDTAALRATLSDLRRRLEERQTDAAALIKRLDERAGEEPRPPTPATPKRPRRHARSGDIGAIAAAAVSTAVPTSAPSEASSGASHLLCRAKLVGVRYTTELRHEPDLLPELSLDVVILEDFNGPFGSLATAWDAYQSLRWRDDVDLGGMSRETYDATMATLLPSDVRLGDECLMHFTWSDTTKRLAAIEPWTAEATDAFLARHAALVVPPLADSIENAFDQTFESIPSTIRQTALNRRQALNERSLAGRLIDNWHLAGALRNSRRSLDVRRTHVERTAARLKRIRDTADPEMRDLADRSLVAVPSILAQAEAFDRQLLVAARLDPYWGPFVTTYTEEEVGASFK